MTPDVSPKVAPWPHGQMEKHTAHRTFCGRNHTNNERSGCNRHLKINNSCLVLSTTKHLGDVFHQPEFKVICEEFPNPLLQLGPCWHTSIRRPCQYEPAGSLQESGEQKKHFAKKTFLDLSNNLASASGKQR